MPQMTGAAVLAAFRAAGADEQTAMDLTRIAWRESRWKPEAHRSTVDKTLLRGDLGLVQINYTNDTDRAKQAVGYSTRRDWFDPQTNARMAMYLVNDNRSRGGNGYDAWRAGPGGFTTAGTWSYGTPSEEQVRAAIATGKPPSATNLSDWVDYDGPLGTAVQAAAGPLGYFLSAGAGIGDLIKRAVAILSALLSPDWWRRVGIFVLGGLLVIASLIMAAQ